MWLVASCYSRDCRFKSRYIFFFFFIFKLIWKSNLLINFQGFKGCIKKGGTVLGRWYSWRSHYSRTWGHFWLMFCCVRLKVLMQGFLHFPPIVRAESVSFIVPVYSSVYSQPPYEKHLPVNTVLVLFFYKTNIQSSLSCCLA